MLWSRIVEFFRGKPEEAKPLELHSDTLSTLCSLTRGLDSHDQSDVESTARRIAAILQKLKPEQWSEAYLQLRYAQIKDAELYSIARNMAPDVGVHLVGLATLHGSGFVRERALRELGNYKEPDALPYLLLRLNDWVRPVSKLAQQILHDNLAVFSSSQFAKHHHLVEALDRFQRVDVAKIRQKIFVWMNQSVNREELLQRADNGPIRERVFCYRMLTPVLREDPSIVRRAIRNTAPEVRTWGIAHLRLLPDWETHLRSLFRDPSTRVRLKAVRFIQDQGGAGFDDSLHEMIFDDYRSVREVSRVILKNRGVSDFRALYRQWLPTKDDEGVLAGYIEVSDSSICDELKTYLCAKAKLRAIALLGLAKFRYADIGSECVKAIMANNHKLRATAVDILMRSQVVFDANDLRNLPKSVGLPSRRAALKVLASGGRLEVLRDLLFVFVHDNELRPEAYRYLNLKYDRDRVYPYFSKNEVLKAEIEGLGPKAIQVANDNQKTLLQNAVNLVKNFA